MDFEDQNFGDQNFGDQNFGDQNFGDQFEIEILKELINNPEYFAKVVVYLKPKYFENIGTQKIFEKIKDFYSEYHNKPTLRDVGILLKDEPQKIKEVVVPTIKELASIIKNDADNTNNVNLLVDKTEEFIKKSIHKEALIIGAEGIGENNEEKLKKSYSLIEEAQKVSLKEDFGISIEDVDEFISYLNDDENQRYILPGIPEFDSRLGKGIYSKSLTTFLAPPGIGKTASMIAFGCEFLKQGKDVVFFSLEMNEFEILKRIYANLLDIPINNLPIMEPKVLKDEITALLDSDNFGSLRIKEFPSYSANSIDIDTYLEKYTIETKIEKPIVFVDYLGLLGSSRLSAARTNSYEFIKSITAEIRGIAQKRDIHIFTAHQLNRSAIGNLEAGQESVADSAGISAFSDAMIFILSTKAMKEIGKLVINFEKNRYSGDTSTFEIGFDYPKMKFIPLVPSNTSQDTLELPNVSNSFAI